MESASDRVKSIAGVRSDPPLVHTRANVAGGYVWATTDDCYEFLAECCRPGTRTLETGLGISTVLFTIWGCEHTCVVPFEAEVERCIAYLDERGIDRSCVTFEVGRSEDVLPRLDATPIDVAFIDGGHGFPMTIVDFFYTAGRLVEGGWLVLDDMQLPSVRLGLVDFLELDPRWEHARRSNKWASWRRVKAGPVSEHERKQTFLGGDDRPEPWRRRMVPKPLRPIARQARDALRAPRHNGA
jgi:hypothetical protein